MATDAEIYDHQSALDWDADEDAERAFLAEGAGA
jgi:hypothetical protein